MTLPPAVLMLDTDSALAESVCGVLAENGYRAHHFSTSEEICDHLTLSSADLILVDADTPGGGLGVIETIRARQSGGYLPVIILASDPLEDYLELAIGAGAADVVVKPFRTRELLARIKMHVRLGREINETRAAALSHAEMMNILQEITTSLRPGEIFRVLVRRVAESLGISRCSILLASPGEKTATVVAAFEDPTITDLPVRLDGYPELRRALEDGKTVLVRDVASNPLYDQARPEWEAAGYKVPTTSAVAIPFELQGRRAGLFFLRTAGDDTILGTADVQFAEGVIAASIAAIEKAYDIEQAVRHQEEMKQLAETDPLTGLVNRRALSAKLSLEVDRAERYQTPLTCIVIDLDHFKATNDTHGHHIGDLVLQQVAQLLRREQRSVDLVARYGGEEFVVVLPETGATGARIFAERILRKVMAHRFGDPNHVIQLTLSMGIATLPDSRAANAEALLKLADANLLKAKGDGRNRYRD